MGEQGRGTMSAGHWDEHERIRAIAAALDGFLDAGAPPTDPAFARARWSLSREVSMHLARERCEQASGAPAGIDANLEVVLQDHMRQWTGGSIQAEWARYRIAARGLLHRLRRRMDYEDRGLRRA